MMLQSYDTPAPRSSMPYPHEFCLKNMCNCSPTQQTPSHSFHVYASMPPAHESETIVFNFRKLPSTLPNYAELEQILLFSVNWGKQVWAMLGFRSAPKKKSCIWSSNEHFCQVWFKSVLWFQKKRWKCEIPIGSYVKLCRVMVAILNFRSANDSQLVQDHPMIIPAKSQFNWLSGF